MKKADGFDNAVGTFETYVGYLKPLNGILTSPLLIVGLEKPDTFRVVQRKVENKTVGDIEILSTGKIKRKSRY